MSREVKNYVQKIVYGMSNIHVAPMNLDGSYGMPVSILGAKRAEANFNSSDKTIYADNRSVYSDRRVVNGDGTLEVLGLTTDEKCILAGTENMNGGFAVSATTNAPSLALMFEQEKADGGKLLTVIYNAQFSIPGIAAVSTESDREEQTYSLDFGCLASLDEKGWFYYVVDTTDKNINEDVIANWFAEVQKPSNIKPSLPNTPLTLTGVNNVTVDFGSNFNPLQGVTATDKEDGDLTSSIVVTGSVNTSQAGVQPITYKVTDSGGLKTEKIRQVTVKEEVIPEEPTEVAKK